MQVKVENLKKYFNKTKAVDDISFTFASGQVVGFIGPNGAGKTTTMRIMATLDEPTEGDISLNGYSVVQDPEKSRKMIGFMPDSLPTHRDMTIDDYLDFFARAFGIRAAERKMVIEGVEEFAGLKEIRTKTLNSLSKGMKQRVSLARALVHDPPVLVLDEPAAGLDPRARIELRELLRALSKRGKAILVSSHILTELAEICDSTVIIEHGKLLRAGTLKDISGEDLRFCRVLVRTLDDGQMLHKAMLEIPMIASARPVGNAVEADIEGTEQNCHIVLAELIKRGHKVVEFTHRRMGLEDIFMNVTKGMLQ